ncbi:surfactin synthase thioesterase subunit [Crossiella equi]|uniref:Surfactin synthase thioesterase subunit n=1 Tax=Crossiella equi TaxID=130796 RepID=A0ABS5A9V0_9PSEU|nr:alpha/beta fold hydrolase [Crossiella equi]MBP2473362.1 surfactin synthase thioesterase subunit [Crossiella equi]
MTQAGVNPLTALIRPVPRPNATKSLVCIGFAGGGTTSYIPWAQHLPSDVELVVVCFAGRERRFREVPPSSWDGMFTDVLNVVRAAAFRPYVLVGHSIGAALAYEVAVELEKEGGAAAPEAVVISGHAAPHLADPQPIPPGTTDDDLVQYLVEGAGVPAEALADPAAREMMLRTFRADITAYSEYRPKPNRLKAPLQVLVGEEDLPAEATEAWQQYAAGSFSHERLAGGHFYTDEGWVTLPKRFSVL